MTTLITGATGFLGSVLVRQLLDQGANIRILRRESSKLDLLGACTDRVAHTIGDVTDLESVRDAMRGVSRVYHVAGYVEIMAQKRSVVAEMRRVNVLGTANVVDAALAEHVTRLVHTSSIAALGRKEPVRGLTDETAVWQASRMNTHYAVSKHDAELQVYRGLAEGLDAVIVNPSVIFGPGRPGENTMEIFETIKKRLAFAVPTGGVNVVDVEDVARGMILSMERGRKGERYILGGESLGWAEVFRCLAHAAGVPAPRLRLPRGLAMGIATVMEYGARLLSRNPRLDRKTARGLFQYWRISSQKAIEELGYDFRPFVETAARLAAAFP